MQYAKLFEKEKKLLKKKKLESIILDNSFVTDNDYIKYVIN